jgi:hypothetical protein
MCNDSYLSNITSIKEKMICPYQLLLGNKPRLPEILRSFGEISVVTNKKDIQGKLTNRGTPCMIMGYSINHAHDAYRMLNIETKKIIKSRDIVWMNKVYKDWKDQKDKKNSEVDDDDAAVEPKIQAANKTQVEVQEEKVLDEQKRAKVYSHLRQLESSFNLEAAKIVERIEQRREILFNHANFAFIDVGTVVKEPTTLEEAWNHDDPRSQEKWRKTINEEFEEIDKKQVWEVMKKEDIPQDRRTNKCKWIFKIKRNGVFRARLVACGYSQIHGVDFNEIFAPVVNDVSCRIILSAKLLWDLQASIVDVETAFLHGNLQEEIYINVPKGMNQDDNTCLLLKKTIYGLVQSARVFYNELLSTLKSMGFNENKSDPCLLSRWINGKVIMIGIYVDDCLVVGKEDQIQEVIQGLKASGFNFKVESSLKDYLSLSCN